MKLPWQKKPEFLTAEEKELVLEAIRQAETRTSGEVRVFLESRCRFMDALDRAKELFFQLRMEQTADRNASLVYVAVKDRQVAVFGDEGIHRVVGPKYWEEEVNKMLGYFKEQHLGEGLAQVVTDIGQVLHTHFPYNQDTDKNELPDEIVFGK
ncbi:MAG TPA: TPM domain-containing protein [Chitinophagaceae bacterium]|jgi:uncharacterized membrane protein|nr:TPM domain-containing protein [Chitinophagaceae bacterium]